MDEVELAELAAFIRGQLDAHGMFELRVETDAVLAEWPVVEDAEQTRRAEKPGMLALRYLRALRTSIALDLDRGRILTRATGRINAHLADWSENQLEGFTLIAPLLTRGTESSELDIPLSSQYTEVEATELDNILRLIDEAIELVAGEVQ
jgi:hypothetical protein